MGRVARLGRPPILLMLVLALAGARGSGGAVTPPPAVAGPQEVTVMGVFVDPHARQPVVVLQGKRDKKSVAMVIGPAEATGIAVPLSNVTPPRPLTHDLFLSLFGRLNVKVDKVLITDLRDNTYFATLYLTANGSAIEMDSRPSDAIALAVRAKAPVYVEDRVFDKASQLPGPATPPGSRI
jgi:bifunctional DNase/RNase